MVDVAPTDRTTRIQKDFLMYFTIVNKILTKKKIQEEINTRKEHKITYTHQGEREGETAKTIKERANQIYDTSEKEKETEPKTKQR